MRVYDKETGLHCIVNVESEFSPVRVTKGTSSTMVRLVTEYLKDGRGWGGQMIDMDSTTLYDVVTCLGGNDAWLLVDIPKLVKPDVPEGAIG